MSLKKKALTGIAWSFAQQFSVQFISFFVSIILARLLLPAEFGLIGLIAVFIAVGNTLMNGGLTTSLIRTQDPEQKDYSTVFFINLTGSVIVYLCLYFSAPFIALFFKQKILTEIIRLYTLSFIINAFAGVQTARLTKAMDFKTQMAVQIPSLILGAALGIILAYKGYGVWSLVWMNLAQSALSAIQLWFYSGWRPDFSFDKARFRYHFGFGYKLMLSGLLDTIFSNIYNIVIGKFFSVAQLGFYTRALSVRQLPVQNISTALNKVTFPLFSGIQRDDARLKSVYKRLMQQVLFWVSAILVCLFVIAEPFFRVLFTEKWLPAVPYFQLLCVGGIMYPLQSYNLNILHVKGRSDLFLRLEIIKKTIVVIGIACAIPFGIYGLLYFQILSSFIAYFINSWYSGRMINYPLKEQIADILPIFTIAIMVGGAAWLLDYWLVSHHAGDLFRIAFVLSFYFILHLGLSIILKLPSIADFKQLVLKR